MESVNSEVYMGLNFLLPAAAFSPPTQCYGSEWVSKGPAPLLGRTIRNGKPADSRRRKRRDDGIADLQHPGT